MLQTTAHKQMHFQTDIILVVNRMNLGWLNAKYSCTHDIYFYKTDK